MAAQSPSYEEKVEDFVKKYLTDQSLTYYTKTEKLNDDIAKALEKYPSKGGGKGKNHPDIQLMYQSKSTKLIPVMIECKGKKGLLAKFKEHNLLNANSSHSIKIIENFKEDGTKHFANIKAYALNGAIHYADAVTFYSSYKECLAIGINGYESGGDLTLEYAVYVVSSPNIYQKLGDFSDLSFLKDDDLDEQIADLKLSEEEIEAKTKDIESQMEMRLVDINESIYGDIKTVGVGARVKIIVGMIIAALGVENKLAPLKIDDLKGENNEYENDGEIFLRKIKSFAKERGLSQQKQEMISGVLRPIFISRHLYESKNGESILKIVYRMVLDNIMPYLKNNSKYHLDFTGQLFNVLNRYIDIPDGEKNDVVLTPRYVCDLMARLCEVNKDSFVWDYALGTGGFLISAMRLMIEDAKNSIKSKDELAMKTCHIKSSQLLGIEIRDDIALLAVLNMILMGDGSANIINEDSLQKFNGKYQDSQNDFPANVFLLNPPYSAPGKGFNFVKEALSKMKSGKAAVLIQENAGQNQGLPYTEEILTHSTLLASIKMPPKLFLGSSSVQTAIYLFEVGKAHDKNKLVKFIDFSEDGYQRQNRKKSKNKEVNLRDDGSVKARYKELVDIVLNRSKNTNFYDKCFIEDTIALSGKDWTFNQHQKIDTTPKLEDFKKCVSEYLAWEVSNVLKNSAQDSSKDDSAFH